MKYVLAFFLGLATYPLMCDVVSVGLFHTQSEILDKVHDAIWIPNYGIADALTKGCTKDISKNGHGWVFMNRQYYRCNKVQIYVSDLVFGETTRPTDPEMMKEYVKQELKRKGL